MLKQIERKKVSNFSKKKKSFYKCQKLYKHKIIKRKIETWFHNFLSIPIL